MFLQFAKKKTERGNGIVKKGDDRLRKGLNFRSRLKV